MSSDTDKTEDKWYPPGQNSAAKINETNISKNKGSNSRIDGMSRSLVEPSQKPGPQIVSGSWSTGSKVSYAAVVAKTSPKGKQNILTGPGNFNISEDDFPALGSSTSSTKVKHVMNIDSNDHKRDIPKVQSQSEALSMDGEPGQNIVPQNQGSTDRKEDAFSAPVKDLSHSNDSENFTQIKGSDVEEASSSNMLSDARSQHNEFEPSKKTPDGDLTSQISLQNPPALSQWPVLHGNTNGNQQANNIPDLQNTDESKMEGQRSEIGPEFEGDSEQDYSQDHRSMFEFFWRSSSPFSQEYRSGFVADGKFFNTAEQYMIYQKALLFDDTELAGDILSADNPKNFENDMMKFDQETWEKHCFQIVKDGNKLKFSQDVDLKNHLYSTLGKILVNAHPDDTLLGIGLHKDDQSAWNRATWQGKNLLGYALTEICKEMFKSDPFSDKDPYNSSGESRTEEELNNSRSDDKSQRIVSQGSNNRSGASQSAHEFSPNSSEQEPENTDHTHRSGYRNRSSDSERTVQGAEAGPEQGEDYSQDHRDMFEYFWQSHSPFSQWYHSKFKVNGKSFHTAEQYMMYHKALLFGDDEIAKQILSTKDPRQQKKLGRKVRNFDEETWQKHCFKIVKEGNRQKFSQHDDLKGHLYSTYGKILVEASPVDTMWGIGLYKDDELAWSRATWQGRNLLGYALTELRDEMMVADGLLCQKTEETQF